jgi:hypothetical protein
VELGSLAELLSAFGTLAALVAAGIAARAAIRTNNQQADQLRQLEEAERRRQVEAEQREAAMVALWPGVNQDGPAIWYMNRSGLPVYGLLIRARIPGRTFELTWQSLGPAFRDDPLGRMRRELLAHAPDGTRPDWAGLLESGQFWCAAIFCDTAGRWWLRDFRGRLSRHPDEDAARRELDASGDGPH